jgi:hypothetical protein
VERAATAAQLAIKTSSKHDMLVKCDALSWLNLNMPAHPPVSARERGIADVRVLVFVCKG